MWAKLFEQLASFKDIRLKKTVFILGLTLGSFYVIQGILYTTSFTPEFIQIRLLPLTFLGLLVLSLGILQLGMTPKYKTVLKWINTVLTGLIVFLIVFSFIELMKGEGAFYKNQQISLIRKTSVYEAGDSDTGTREKIIKKHVRKEYPKVKVSKGFETTATVQVALVDDDQTNSLTTPDTQLLFQQLAAIDPLPVLKATQVFSMDTVSFGTWTKVEVKPLIGIRQSRRIGFFSKIWFGVKKSWQFIKNIFRKKNKKIKVNQQNIERELTKKCVINFQLQTLEEIKKRKKIALKGEDLLLYEAVSGLNDSLNNYIGGLTTYRNKLNVLSLGTVFLHELIWGARRGNRKQRKEHLRALDSLRNIVLAIPDFGGSIDSGPTLATTVPGTTRPAAASKNSATGTKQPENGKASPAANASQKKEPAVADISAGEVKEAEKVKTTPSSTANKQPTVVTEVDTLREKGNGGSVKRPPMVYTPPGSGKTTEASGESRLSSERIIEVHRGSDPPGSSKDPLVRRAEEPEQSLSTDPAAANESTAIKEPLASSDRTDPSASEQDRSSSVTTIGRRGRPDIDGLMRPFKFRKPKYRAAFRRNLEAIFKKKWVRPEKGDFIIFNGEIKGTAELRISEVLGYTESYTFNYELINYAKESPSIRLIQDESSFYPGQLEPEVIRISIIEYDNGAKVMIKYKNGQGIHEELWPFVVGG